MPLAWSFDATIPAPPERVYAWLSDLREDDHAHPAYLEGAGISRGKAAKRSVLPQPGGALRVVDVRGHERFVTDVTLVPEEREVRIVGPHGYRATWRAQPEAGGTRVVCEGALAPTGLLRFLVPLFAKGMLRQTRRDFDGHVAHLRHDLARP